MYEKIRSRKSVPQLYEDKLIVRHSSPHENAIVDLLRLQSDDVMTHEDAIALRSTYKSRLENHLTEISSYKPTASMLEDQWSGMVWPASAAATHNPETGVDRQTLEKVGKASVQVPEGFVGDVYSTETLFTFLPRALGNSSEITTSRQTPSDEYRI